MDGGRPLGPEPVGTGVTAHHGRVGTDVRRGEVRTAPLGVLLEKVGDVRGEPEDGHRGAEAPGQGDEPFPCPGRDVRRLGDHAAPGGEPGDDPPVTLLEDPRVGRVGVGRLCRNAEQLRTNRIAGHHGLRVDLPPLDQRPDEARLAGGGRADEDDEPDGNPDRRGEVVGARVTACAVR